MSRPVDRFTRKKVAIVGSGCTGIAALWALNRTYHDVYLYEAADRLGGHTNTVQWKSGKYTTAVDTGFIVLNTATYRESIRGTAPSSWLGPIANRCSQLPQLPQQDQCPHREDGDDIRCLPGPGTFRMGGHQPGRRLLPEAKLLLPAHVEDGV